MAVSLADDREGATGDVPGAGRVTTLRRDRSRFRSVTHIPRRFSDVRWRTVAGATHWYFFREPDKESLKMIGTRISGIVGAWKMPSAKPGVSERNRAGRL